MRKINQSFLTKIFILAAIILMMILMVPLINTLVSVEPATFFKLFQDQQVLSSMRLTFGCALVAVLIGFLTAVPMGYLLARYNFPGRDFLQALVNLPVIIPHTAAGVALLLVFGRNGIFGQAFAQVGITFTDRPAGIVIGMLFVSVPFLVNASREAFAGVDREMELASRVDGANHWQMLRFVTLPQCWRGITSGALMMWARGVSEFGAVVILAYNPKIMPVLVFERFQGFGLPAALPVTVFLILVSLIIFLCVSVFLFPRKKS
ncbi:MAG: ABC transporter permease [Anaerolineaceae bacterium]|nr:ABC transporter permease [Anaerolineaceae bacterium]